MQILVLLWPILHMTRSSFAETLSTSRYVDEDKMAYDIVQVNAGRKLSSFNSYKDVVLTEYVVPEASQGVVFGFSSTASSACTTKKTISVYIQHGGFPLFLEDGGSWSDKVFPNRSDFAVLEFPSTDTTWKISIPSPRAGRWYSGVFLKEPVDYIKQSGLFAKCEITYFSSFLVSAYPDPIVILTDGQISDVYRERATVASKRIFRMCLKDTRVDFVDVDVQCPGGCDLMLRARSDALPYSAKPVPLTGLQQKYCPGEKCTLSYVPIQGRCQYVQLLFNDSSSIAVYSVSMSSVKCRIPQGIVALPASGLLHNPSLDNPDPGKTAINESYYQLAANQVNNPYIQPSCPYVLDLSRLDSGPAFVSSFGLNHQYWPNPETIFIPRSAFSDTILQFELIPTKDSGGTLIASLDIADAPDEDLQNLTLVACLNLGIGSRFNIENDCAGAKLKVNASKTFDEVFIPYPESGLWQFNIQGHPQPRDEASDIHAYIPVKLSVKITQCVKGGCGAHGACRVTLNGGTLLSSSCNCYAGWRGWDCTNSGRAESIQDLFVAVFLLTISNLFFIPAAVVAARRKYYTEALVYFSTCFFSSFYHACDQPLKKLALCIMDFGVLQYCDFYVSILSFWVTMIAMADLPYHFKSVAQMAGCIGIALGVEYEKTGIWVFAVPALTALGILVASWGFRSYRLKRVAPSKRYWLIHFLPGFIFATLGLVLFAFVETKSNYKFVHSFWHIAMALAVVFFLPPVRHRHNGKYPNLRSVGTEQSNLSTTTSLSQSQELAKDSGTNSPDDAQRINQVD